MPLNRERPKAPAHGEIPTPSVQNPNIFTAIKILTLCAGLPVPFLTQRMVKTANCMKMYTGRRICGVPYINRLLLAHVLSLLDLRLHFANLVVRQRKDDHQDNAQYQ